MKFFPISHHLFSKHCGCLGLACPQQAMKKAMSRESGGYWSAKIDGLKCCHGATEWRS